MNTGHVGLNVSDIERSREFYREVFGFEVMVDSSREGQRFVFLGDGKKLILTLWQQSEGRFDKNRPGLHHLSFQVETIDKVKEAEQRLRSLNAHFHYEGIVPHQEGADSGGIFFEDPDGTRLEIYSPTGAKNQTAPISDGPSCGFF